MVTMAVAVPGKGGSILASLNIDFSYDDNVKRSINGAKSSLSTRINDYAGIKRNLNNMSSSTGNLSTANTYIQKKINALQSKYDKLESFRTAVTNFNTNAEAADRRVANRINTETNQFYKREGIKTGILYTIGSVLGKGADWLRGKIEEAFDAFITGAKTVWTNIKQWYEDNKHWIDVVIDVVCVVAAIAAVIASGGVLATVFAVWGLAKASADLIYDSIALSYYNDGDMEKYEEMSKKGLKDFMKGTMGEFGEVLYYGMDIASIVFSAYKIGTVIKDFSTGTKTFGAIIHEVVGTKGLKSVEGVKKVAAHLGNAAFVVKSFRNLAGSDSLVEGIVKSIKITKMGWDTAANFVGLNSSTIGKWVIKGTVISIAPPLIVAPAISINVNFNTCNCSAAA